MKINEEIIQCLLESKLIKLSEIKKVSHEPFPVVGSVTNKYFLIKISKHPKYIYRLPGKQWGGGFSRLTEAYNLEVVKLAGIDSAVLYFDSLSGQQILSYSPKNTTLKDLRIRMEKLQIIASSFRKLHESNKKMQNDYNVSSVFLSSYARVSAEHRHFFSKEKPILERILLDWMAQHQSLVPCHNEPYLTNFINGNNQFKIVDWEYSANNFKEWDLGFFSILAKLNQYQEQQFLRKYYEGDVDFNQKIIHLTIFKPIIAMILVIWSATRLSCAPILLYEFQLKKVRNSQKQLKNCMVTLFKKVHPLHATLSQERGIQLFSRL